MATGFTTTVVLGKRKAQSSEEKLSLRLESLPPGSNELPTESAHDINASSGQAPAFIAHDSSSSRERRFKCLHEGCLRAYTKPSRLAEHERSHTGNVCDLTFLRPTVPHCCARGLLFAQHATRNTYERHIFKLTRVPTFLRLLDPLFA